MNPHETLLMPCLHILHQPALYAHRSWLQENTLMARSQVFVDVSLRKSQKLTPGCARTILADEAGATLVRHWPVLGLLAAMLHTWLLRADIVAKNLLHTVPARHRALLHLPIIPPAPRVTGKRLNFLGSHEAGEHALVQCAHSVSPALGQRVALAFPKPEGKPMFAAQDTMTIRSALNFIACYVN